MPESPPDPEVPEKARRRRHNAEYKLQILEEADRATEPGEVGALLRREGLYSSHLAAWRKQRREGTLAGPRGRKGKDPLEIENEQLRKENARLVHRLDQAETIISVQKKLSRLLGIEQPTGEDTES
ncbi:MAG: transposase [Actinobacteria bacterium]|nr:transposase [Actinomycetota bacterium]